MSTVTSSSVEESIDAPTNKMTNKKPSFILWLGIVFLPIVAVWFTLRVGYSSLVRAVAFGWLGICLVASQDGGQSAAESAAETVLTNYMLASTGKGICETVTGKDLKIISRGTAAYEWTKPEPAVLGTFSATCTYFNVGKEYKTRDEWAFFVVTEESSGNSESVILGVENMDRVKSALQARNFVEDASK